MTEDVRPRFGPVPALGIHKYYMTVAAIDSDKYSNIKGNIDNHNIMFDIYHNHNIYKILCYKEVDDMYMCTLEVSMLPIANRTFLAEMLMDFYTDEMNIDIDNDLIAYE